MSAHTAVVILNYNGRHFLEKFLPGVLAHSGQAQIVVADNASTDDSVAWLNSHYPQQVHVIAMPQNTGFAQGYNVALNTLRQQQQDPATALPQPIKYYMLLNSDVEVTPGWLDPLEAFLAQNTGAGACQPTIRAWHQKDQFEYAGAAGGFIDALGYPFCRGRLFNSLEGDQGQYNQPLRVFWATGACMLIRAELFHDLGGFDKDFFAHMEEIDLCWRMNRAGHEAWCLPQSHVFHVGGGTLNKTSPRKTYLNFRNGLSMMLKNMPWSQLWYKIPVRLVLDGVAGLAFLVLEGPQHTLAIIKAHFHFYALWRKNMRKRKGIKWPKRVMNRHEVIMPGSLVAAYYLLRKRQFSQLPLASNTKGDYDDGVNGA